MAEKTILSPPPPNPSPLPTFVSSAAMAWAREYPQGSTPHFFKIFFPCNSSKHLGIPRGFCKYIKPQNPGYVALAGPSGNVWNVKLVRAADGGMSFQNGWEEFVADHNLGIGDFLVFRYDGDLNFRVLVFDPTSCEKEDSFHVLPCHEVKAQVESRRRSAREGSADELTTADPKLDTCRRGSNLSVARKAFSKKQNCSIENHLEERPQIIDGSLVTNEVNLDCRSSDLDMLEPQVEPSPLLRNMEPEIFYVPVSLNKCCKDVWMDSNGIDGSHTPQSFPHKKPPSSNKHALSKQCFSSHSDNVAHVVREEPQGKQGKCRPHSGASMLKQNVKNKIEVAEVPQPDKSHDLFVKRKRLAVKRFLRRKRTIFHDSDAVKQHCLERSICLASPSNDDVKIKVCRRVESLRRPVTENEKAKALEAALLFQSKHPFCISVMRDSYVYCGFFMYLPNSFTQHVPRCTMNMKLRDSVNMVWRVTYKYYGRGGALSAGWGEFSRDHNLEIDDVCIFELVKPDEIQVHIFRVVEEITPFIWNSRRRKKQ